MTTPRLLTSCLLLLIGLSVADRPAHACGPDLPKAMLQRDHAALCAAPALRLGPQLARLAPAHVRARANVSTTAEAEQLDLSAALAELGLDPWEIEARLAQVAEYRAQLEDRERHAEPALPLPELPEQFRLYLEGARAWHTNRGEARASFAAILELPADRRRYRSVWAAYMLAKLGDGPGCRRQDRAWSRVRELARAGFDDSLGLAAASYGEQALCWHWNDDPGRALALYLEQSATGDTSAQASIEFVLAGEFRAETNERGRLRALAADPQLRELVGAWLVARGVSDDATRWLATLEAAGQQRAVAAGPLAWSAYRAGDMSAAERWAKLGAPNLDHGDVLARWVLAKLELRRGDIDRATLALADIEQALSETDRASLELGEWRYDNTMTHTRARRSAAVELGVLELHQAHFQAALAAFVRADSYLDAAYLAEQVLTVDELDAFVSDKSSASFSSLSGRESLRWLLGRRLARSGQWGRAAAYFPEQWRAEAEAHRDDVTALRDPGLNDVSRARLLWRMAQRMRKHGMELRGTELDPDWTIYAGAFAPAAIWSTREADESPSGPSRSERERVDAQRVTEPRFHYRWHAAELAWEAAELLPDQHPATARVLCIAGGWIADRDHQGADRFYKAIVARNGAVDVGHWADEIGWFPNPDQCGMQGVDFAQPAVRLPFGTPPRPPSSMRSLIRSAWPFAALIVLLSAVGMMLMSGRRPTTT